MNSCDILTRDQLSKNGFVYRKKSWYRTTENFLQIINFQKSSWGNQYYINIGADFLVECKNGSINLPPMRLFPFWGRVEDLAIRKDLLDCLDFERCIEDDERNNKMNSIINECIAFLDRVRTLEGLKQEYQNSSILKGFFIQKSFYSVLSQ